MSEDDTLPVTESTYTLVKGVLRPEITLEDTIVFGQRRSPDGCCIGTEFKTIEEVARDFEANCIPNLKKNRFQVIDGPEIDPNPLSAAYATDSDKVSLKT